MPSTEAPGQLNILLVEDTAALARTYMGYLRHENFHVQHSLTGQEALGYLSTHEPDAVLLDLKLPDMDGREILKHLHNQMRGLPVIVITAHGSIGGAVDAMREGAVDFLVKPFGADRLITSLNTHIDRHKFTRAMNAEMEEAVSTRQEDAGERAAARPQEALPDPNPNRPASKMTINRRNTFQGFVGQSNAMQAVYRAIEQAAGSNATVFISGESGTGKELTASAVHNLSPRKDRAFVPINCAAIPSELMESEIFGHVKGAFTGAVSDKAGAARLADGGTLFLDEICEMSLHLQTKLLRFIQTGTFSPVGQPQSEQVDARFICATNRDPLEEVTAGRFREDLYYRLHVLPIALPPLRERDRDVVQLAEILLRNFAAEENKGFDRLAEDAQEALLAYAWPGNVRQLQNVLRNAIVLNDGQTLAAGMLPSPVRPGKESGPNLGPAPKAHMKPGVTLVPEKAENTAPDPYDLATLSSIIRPLEEVERETILKAVRVCKGDVRKAAVFLGVSPATIYRKQKIWKKEGFL